MFRHSVLLPISPQRLHWPVNISQPLATQIGPRVYAFGKLLSSSLLLPDKLRAFTFDSTDDPDLDDTEPLDLLLLSVVKTTGPTGDGFSSDLRLVSTASGARNPAAILPYWSDHMLMVLGILRMFGVNILLILKNSLCTSSSSRLEKHRSSHLVILVFVIIISLTSSMSLLPACHLRRRLSYTCLFTHVTFTRLHVTHTK